ncbi:MAG: hypothetical protein ACREVL_19270 [Solimonas sp.]
MPLSFLRLTRLQLLLTAAALLLAACGESQPEAASPQPPAAERKMRCAASAATTADARPTESGKPESATALACVDHGGAST